MEEKKKRDKSKMLFVTFMGIALIAAGLKIGQLIQEKFGSKKENEHDDCCG